jgi:hypothetical protein
MIRPFQAPAGYPNQGRAAPNADQSRSPATETPVSRLQPRPPNLDRRPARTTFSPQRRIPGAKRRAHIPLAFTTVRLIDAEPCWHEIYTRTPNIVVATEPAIA